MITFFIAFFLAFMPAEDASIPTTQQIEPVLSDSLLVGEKVTAYENASAETMQVTLYFGSTNPSAKAVAMHYEEGQQLEVKESTRRIKAVTFQIEYGGSIELQCERVSGVYCKCPYSVVVH